MYLPTAKRIRCNKVFTLFFVLLILFAGIDTKIKEARAARPTPPPKCDFYHYEKPAHPSDMTRFGHNPF